MTEKTLPIEGVFDTDTGTIKGLTDGDYVYPVLTPTQVAATQSFVSGDGKPASGVYVLTASDNGGTIYNSSKLPLWVLIPAGLSGLRCRVAQRGRGRVYVCPGSGVEANGVVGVGRYSTTRRGEALDISQVGANAYAVQYDSVVTVINGRPMSGYFTRDTSAANTTTAAYSVTGDLVTVTDTAHGLTSRLNGRPVYLMASTGILNSGIYDDWQYVDANTYTVRAPSAIPDGTAKTGAFSGGANYLKTNTVNEANTLLIGGSGATYSVTGNVVTVTWTAHGLTATYNGANAHMSFSSGVLTTDVYRDFLYIDANTFSVISPTHYATTQTGSLASNTSETLLCHATIPGDVIGRFGSMTFNSHWQHLANANSKNMRMRLSRAQVANGFSVALQQSSSTQTRQTLERTIYARGNGFILSAPGGSGTEASFDGTTVAGQLMKLDMGVEQVVKVTASLGAATDWIYLGGFSVTAKRDANNHDLGHLGGGFVGVNISGLEFGTTLPGIVGIDYKIPPASDFVYWASKGIKRFRVPIKWERIAPTLSGALDTAYLGYIQGCLANAAAVGGSCIVDLHNYGKYGGTIIGSGPAQADLVDVWTRLATALVGTPGLGGYEIMNEPDSAIGLAAIQAFTQACIDAIRTVDTSATIYAGGVAQSASQSMSTNESLRLYDSANRLVLTAHMYPDATSSGTQTGYASESAAFNNTYLGQPAGPGGFAQGGRGYVAAWAQYLTQLNAAGAITETGVPWGDDERWRSENLVQSLGYMLSLGMPVYLWGGGSMWSPTYSHRIHPQAATPDGDMPQMAYVAPFIAAYNR